MLYIENMREGDHVSGIYLCRNKVNARTKAGKTYYSLQLQDRTGTVCYLLEALLGVDEVSLMKDYQLSGLHHGGVSADEMSEFVGRLKGLSGATMQEKVEGYLLSIGVTAEEIASIRHIFLGETI